MTSHGSAEKLASTGWQPHMRSDTALPCPRQPSSYPRRVLLAVTGHSPQVVTETLFALAIKEQPAFVPTEIHLITTTEGAERARLMLLDADAGRYFQLLDDYSIDSSVIAFDETHIHLMTSENGEALSDIQTKADNTAVADTIIKQVSAITEDSQCALHASIAGGRKTMGFYLGYALSLYGRAQDRLSHVLVSSPFESHHKFYYPPVIPHRMMIHERPVHTRDAKVMLADIPFVRLRDGLPSRLQNGGASFSHTVEAAQRALEPAHLGIDLANRKIMAGREIIELATADFTFYTWLATRQQQGQKPVHWTDNELQHDYLDHCRQICGAMSQQLERTEVALKDGFTKEWLEQRKSKTNAAIRKALGGMVAKPYLIHSHGKRPCTRSGLSLPPESIEFAPVLLSCLATRNNND